MGISVPIASEYYKLLKEISDERGLGLKRTLEFLVTYYSEREKAGKVLTEKKTRKVSVKNYQKNPTRFAQKERLPQRSFFEEIPPIDSSMEETGYFEEISDTTSEIEAFENSPDNFSESGIDSQQIFSPLPSESETTTERHNYMTPDNFFKRLSRSINQFCYSCGFPLRPNAKFCTNCGTHLKNTNENQDTHTMP